MVSKKKLRFCFYCGSLLQDFDEINSDHCPYCGVKLPYKTKKEKKKISNPHSLI